MRECKACGAIHSDSTEFCPECLAYKQKVEEARRRLSREERRKRYFGFIDDLPNMVIDPFRYC